MRVVFPLGVILYNTFFLIFRGIRKPRELWLYLRNLSVQELHVYEDIFGLNR